MTPYVIEKNITEILKNSRLSSGGMKIRSLKVKLDSSSGLINIDIVLDPGALSPEHRDGLIDDALNSVGVIAYLEEGKWSDVDIEKSGSQVKVHAEGYYDPAKADTGGGVEKDTGAPPKS